MATVKKSAKKSAKKTASKKTAKKSAPERSTGISSDEAAALWELCEEHKGRVSKLERTLQEAIRESGGDASTDELSYAEVPALYALFQRLAPTVTPELREYFQSLVEASAHEPYEHKSNTPGALCLLGATMESWSEFEAYAQRTLGELRALDRLRRLEAEVCAMHFIERGDEGGLGYLREQARRFVDHMERWDKPETAGALLFLLRRRDEVAFECVQRAFATPVCAENTENTLMRVVRTVLSHARDPRLLDAMRAAIRRPLGDHFDGSVTAAYRAFAACGASAAELAAEVEESGDPRPECARCAVAAGMIERAVNKGTIRAANEAIDAIFTSSAKLTKHEVGACAALALTMVEREADGAREVASRVRARAKKVRGADARLLAALEAAVD